MHTARRTQRPDQLELLVVVTAAIAAAVFLSSPHDPAVQIPAVPVLSQGVDHSQAIHHPVRVSPALPVGVRSFVESTSRTRAQADRLAP